MTKRSLASTISSPSFGSKPGATFEFIHNYLTYLNLIYFKFAYLLNEAVGNAHVGLLHPIRIDHSPPADQDSP